MKPESIFDCCSYFLSEKYWLQVHASILKLKIVVSQSLQKGEECAVLFFLFCKNCILSEHLLGSIYSTKKAPLFKRSRYFFAWSQEASYRVSKQVLDQEEIRFCPKLTNSVFSDQTTFWSFIICKQTMCKTNRLKTNNFVIYTLFSVVFVVILISAAHTYWDYSHHTGHQQL